MKPATILLIWLAIANAAAFIMMGVDKKRAQRDRWRIPERTLMLCAALGGSVGAIAGMKAFRHKTKHRKFTVGLPLILALQLAAAALFVLWRKGVI